MARNKKRVARTKDKVKEQYEVYPYPPRDPRDEAKRLHEGSPSHLSELNHYIFGGRRDFSKPFKALVAGGGTGDAAVFLAQQLADVGCPAEVVYIDLSEASRKIAESRVRARKLTNVTFHQLSILDLPGSGLGPFDYIDCCGVLHHLEDPAAGLQALAGVLAEDGGIGFMLYGELGRTGVYPVQDMMHLLTPEDSPSEKVTMARKLLAQLPPSNWLQRNPRIQDHLEGDDAKLFDLLLHSRDRAYKVSEIGALMGGGGFRITTFISPVVYNPAFYINDPKVLERLKELDQIEAWAFAELLVGTISKHVFYVTRQSNDADCVADPRDVGAIPVFRNADVALLAEKAKARGTYTATIYGMKFAFPSPPLAAAILTRIDGARTIADIRAEVQKINPQLSDDAFEQQFLALYGALNGMSNLFLKLPPDR